MHRNKIISLIATIFHLNGASSMIRTTTTNHILPSERFIHDQHQFVDSAQAFGACSKRDWKSASPCLFYLETSRPIHHPDHTIGCKFDVTFPDDTSHDYDIERIELVTIAKDKAVLVLSHGCVHNLYVLHFSNCRAVSVKYNGNSTIRACTWDPFVQAPHDDHFDVLLEGPSEGMLRRITVNVDGKVVDDVPKWISRTGIRSKWLLNFETYLESAWYIRESTFLYSSTKGRLAAFFEEEIEDQKKWAIKILVIDDNGQNHTIKEYVVPANEGEEVGLYYRRNATRPSIGPQYISVTNDLLTACLGVYWKKLTCVQYGVDGDLKFEIHLPIDIDAKGVYNLAGGGFLLAVELCSNNDALRRCSPEMKELIIAKIDHTGNFFGALKIPPFHCDNFNSQITLFEGKKGEYCLSMVCSRKDYWTRETNVHHQITCFDEADYKKDPYEVRSG